MLNLEQKFSKNSIICAVTDLMYDQWMPEDGIGNQYEHLKLTRLSAMSKISFTLQWVHAVTLYLMR